jgi:hypothetical protein
VTVVVDGIENDSEACMLDPLGLMATTRSVWLPLPAESVTTRLVEFEEVATRVPSRYACIFFVRLRLEVALIRNGDATEPPEAGELIVTDAWAAHKDRAMHANVRLNKLENSEFLVVELRVATRGCEDLLLRN